MKFWTIIASIGMIIWLIISSYYYFNEDYTMSIIFLISAIPWFLISINENLKTGVEEE